MNFVRFLRDFFHIDGSGNRSVKYAQGEVYPATEETQSQVVAGSAEPAELMPALPALEVEPAPEPAAAPLPYPAPAEAAADQQPSVA